MFRFFRFVDFSLFKFILLVTLVVALRVCWLVAVFTFDINTNCSAACVGSQCCQFCSWCFNFILFQQSWFVCVLYMAITYDGNVIVVPIHREFCALQQFLFQFLFFFCLKYLCNAYFSPVFVVLKYCRNLYFILFFFTKCWHFLERYLPI